MKAKALLLLLCLIGALLPGYGVAQNQQQQQFEIRWLKTMIDHHHMGVMMAELVEPRAVHEELRDLANEIITAQTAEIQLMKTWLQDWYGIAYEPQMNNRDQRLLDRLGALTGAAFERMWLREMIRHHMMAVMEAVMALRRAYHIELKELANAIIVNQSREIVLMRTWLYLWYGRRC